jgi:hypothetical protein
LLVVAAFSAIIIASQRTLPTVLRMLMFGVATAAIDLIILAQSRGSLLGTAVAVPALLLFSPIRHRILAVMLLVGGCVLIAAPALVHVYSSSDHGLKPFQAALHHSLRMGIFSVAAAAAVGLVWAAASRLGSIPPRFERVAGRAVLALTIAGLASPLVVSAIYPGKARHAASSAWHSFAHSDSPRGGASRFSSLGSSRYDLYRVALGEISNHPVVGIGSDNFAADYLRHRHTDAEPLYPHSDVLRVPAQTGLVGTVLAVVFAGGLLTAGYRSWRAAPTATMALLIPVLYWFVHGAFDWLWEVAGVTAPIAAWAGAAVSLRANATEVRRVPTFVRAAVICAALVAAVPIGADWLSSRNEDAALAHWRTDPAGSIRQLQSAANLNPFSDRPNLLAAVIAAQAGADQTVELRRAEVRNPSNWYTHLLLALNAAHTRSWSVASTEAATASALNPREPTVHLVQHAIRRHRAPRMQSLDQVFLERVAKRVQSGVTP